MSFFFPQTVKNMSILVNICSVPMTVLHALYAGIRDVYGKRCATGNPDFRGRSSPVN